MRIKNSPLLLIWGMLALFAIAALGDDEAHAALSPSAQQVVDASYAASSAQRLMYPDTTNNDTEHPIEIRFYDEYVYLDRIAVLDGTSALPSSAYTLRYGKDSLDQYNGWHYVTIQAGTLAAGNHDIRLTYREQLLKNVVQPIVSNNAKLSDLSLSSGSMTEAFDPERTSYSQSVSEDRASLTVTPIVSDPLATVSIQANNGPSVAVTSGQSSEAITLMNGVNVIRVKVTAPTGVSNTYEITVAKPALISRAAIAGVTAPQAGAAPVTSITPTPEYSATVTWTPATATFSENTVYTATITITPRTAYGLSGVPADFFTVAGAAATNAAGYGVVSAVFPATGANPIKPISIPTIAGVAAPVTGGTPTNVIAATSEYTATVTWSPRIMSAEFNEDTAYTATIRIVPKSGFSLSGVPQNFFKVAGAATTHSAGSGVVTAVFPATGPRTTLPLERFYLPPQPVAGKEIVNERIDDIEAGSLISVEWLTWEGTFGSNTQYVAYVSMYERVGNKYARNVAALFPGYDNPETGQYAYYDQSLGKIVVVYPETERYIDGQALAIPKPSAGHRALKRLDTEQFVADIVWFPGDDVFKPKTAYSATITITPKPGFIFPNERDPVNRLPDNFFTVPGASSTINVDDMRTIAVHYLYTEALVDHITVSAPIVGQAAIQPNLGGYLGSSSWNTDKFYPATSYTLRMTLRADPGVNTLYGFDASHIHAPGASIIDVIPFGRDVADVYVEYPVTPPWEDFIPRELNLYEMFPIIGATPAGGDGSITWSPATSTFAANTVYTATFQISSSWSILDRLPANYFYAASGIGSLSNAYGSAVVTADFLPTGPAPISSPAIAGVSVPVVGGTPVTTFAETAEYQAQIAWSPAVSTFASNTVYNATITLIPKTGYTWCGVPADFFKVAGATTTNAANSGVVTAIFPATGAAPISNPELVGVAEPEAGVVPVTSIPDTDQYTATVAWWPDDALFDGSIPYTATVTITPKAGYTLTGVPADFFTVAGAMTTNEAGSGVVFAEFPKAFSVLKVINEAESANAVQAILDSWDYQYDLGITAIGGWYFEDLTSLSRAAIAVAVYRGGNDYSSVSSIKEAYDTAFNDYQNMAQTVFEQLQGAAEASDASGVQEILQSKHAELGVDIAPFSLLSEEDKLAVATAMMANITDLPREIESSFNAAIYVAALNHASSLEEVQAMLETPLAGQVLENLSYYTELDSSDKLNVETALLDGIPYPVSDAWSMIGVFDNALFTEVMVNTLNAISTTDGMIDELIRSQNLLDLNFNVNGFYLLSLEKKTEVVTALMDLRPFSSAAEIREAFIEIITVVSAEEETEEDGTP